MADVIIVGAGLAGLSCASRLAEKEVSCLVLEASDGVGGRARTDRVDGFLLDRGFQVLLTAYPEAEQLLDYEALSLHSFEPGALVHFDGAFHRVTDPWRRPATALSTLFSPIGTFEDKLKLGKLRNSLTKPSDEQKHLSEKQSTLDFLREYGFSPNLIERFFRPFLSGIFLERELQTPSSMFEFVFRMFSLGDAALPAAGMGAIAQQLASRLPNGSIRLHQTVVKLDSGSVTLVSGEVLNARAIVVATDQLQAAKLLSEVPSVSGRSTACLYFSAEKPPESDAVLVLNGDGSGPINNLCVPSQVCPSYAPAGSHLISASVVGEPTILSPELLPLVQEQLAAWFGKEARSWRHLRTYQIKDALPQQTLTEFSPNAVRSGVYLCGDYCQNSSINGALASGRKTAEEILKSN